MDRRVFRCAAFLAVAAAGCSKADEPDAYGNVEAVEVVVAAEATGRIEHFQAMEGEALAAGAVVGLIETTGLDLERRQVLAQREAAAARAGEARSQADALLAQHRVATRQYERTRRLHAQDAATAQQLDQAEREVRVLAEQVEAARAHERAALREVAAAEAREAAVGDRIARAEIRNPAAGTVLATYVRAGEFAHAGQPLYRVADLRALEVRAYVAQTQLAAVRIGQPAQVMVDVGQDQRRAVPGTVTWVSAQAEFTPTPVQTREERADLVYAVKIRVENPGGLLKIGMPVDVTFGDASASISNRHRPPRFARRPMAPGGPAGPDTNPAPRPPRTPL